MSATASAQAAGQGADQDARTLFDSATIQYARGEFAAAAASFSSAYELSGRPPLLYNMYLAYRDAGQPTEAAAALRRYLAEMPPEDIASQRVMFEGRISTLEAQVAQTAPDEAAAEAVATAEVEPDVDAEPPTTAGQPEPVDSSAPIGALTIVAIGSAAVVGGIVTGVMARGIKRDLDSVCIERRCSPDQQGNIDRGQRLAVITDVLLIGGGALAVGGVLWWILGRGREDNVQASATCMTDGCMFNATGSF